MHLYSLQYLIVFCIKFIKSKTMYIITRPSILFSYGHRLNDRLNDNVLLHDAWKR